MPTARSASRAGFCSRDSPGTIWWRRLLRPSTCRVKAATRSEAGICTPAGDGGDDGYLVTFVTDMNDDRSECVLYEANDMEAGPVCRIMLPHRISSGTHATWAHGTDIRGALA